MAPKQTDKIENPPVASSSEEEEEEESGSSGEESNSSDDEAGDVQSKLTQKKPVAPPPPAKKPESDSEEESESDSDSEPATKTKPLNAVVTKPIPATLPESSTPKRSLKQADNEPKKKAKTSTTTEQAKKKPSTSAADEEVKKISGEEAKKMFQRLFSETDEIAMLQGFLDFTSTKGDPSENMDAFCDYVKTLIDFNASKAQIVTKLQRCKKKFVNIVKNSLKRGKTEDQITYAKDLEQKTFELSRKIWGSDGVLPAKPRKKSKEVELLSTPKKEAEVETQKKVSVVDTHLSSSREMALFFKAENVSVLGLDESTVSAVWDMVGDGPKKREMEEKLKKLKAKQMELCLQRTSLVDYTAKMIFKNNASSSSS
ncbi:GLABROUS1 enhancer-binding protein-like isoform X1 [Brassica napus]|uniref:(rape) hypothetical protein n=1 Tax=Brassica napus TaxID=3708 RepID=A0A816N9P6_BRANA|nr:GLABROUS1 enhancer-binding protein-like isoform X1 [Brassica napus]CAF2028052.1 unnamed protein product [Brassica napus]